MRPYRSHGTEKFMSKKTEKSYREARKERLIKEQKKISKRNPRGVRRRKAKKAIIWAIVIALLAALITGIVLVKTGFVHRRMTAFEIGEEKFTIADYNYWYQMIANQVINSTYTYPDRETVMTNIFSIVGVAKSAMNKGYELKGEDLDNYNATLDQLRRECEAYDGSKAEFFNTKYGFGTNEEIVMRNYKYQLIALKYYDDFREKLKYSDEDLENYYKEFGKETMAMIDFRVAIFSADIGNTFATAYASNADAKAAAERINGLITDEKSFLDAIKAEYTALGGDVTKFKDEDTLEEGFIYSNMNTNLSELSDWLFSANRKANDHAVFTATIDGKEVSYVVYMLKPLYRDDYKTVDMRHILISTSTEGTTLTEEQANAAAKSKIEQIMAEWEELKPEEQTDEKFAEFAKKYSADATAEDGGLLEKIAKNDLVEGIDKFIFEEGRKAGDVKIIQSTYGYHLVYYKGENIEKWKIDAEELLIEKDFEAENKRLCEEYGITMTRSNHAIDVFATEEIDESMYY